MQQVASNLLKGNFIKYTQKFHPLSPIDQMLSFSYKNTNIIIINNTIIKGVVRQDAINFYFYILLS